MEESESESEDEEERECSSLMEGRREATGWAAAIRETLARVAARLSVEACLESEVRLTAAESMRLVRIGISTSWGC